MPKPVSESSLYHLHSAAPLKRRRVAVLLGSNGSYWCSDSLAFAWAVIDMNFLHVCPDLLPSWTSLLLIFRFAGFLPTSAFPGQARLSDGSPDAKEIWPGVSGGDAPSCPLCNFSLRQKRLTTNSPDGPTDAWPRRISRLPLSFTSKRRRLINDEICRKTKRTATAIRRGLGEE